MLLTYRYRVKSHLGELNRQARAVNYVWNYLNDVQKHAAGWDKKFPSTFDLYKLTAGCSKELGLLATTINAVCAQYAQARIHRRRKYLRYRGRKSLGWVPIRGQTLFPNDGAFRFAGLTYRVFSGRLLPPGAQIKDGSSFSQDARGNWFLNVVVEVPHVVARPIIGGVGIDLGLKDFATLSTGEKVGNPHQLLRLADKLAVAQRARKRRQAAKIHARIGNARRDFHHKLSTRIVRQFDYVAVGDVNAAGLARTRMAKSVNDAGWSSFRNQLRYKAIAHGATFEEVNERFTTQTCSDCGSISGPGGLEGLAIREWACKDCGCVHDRDVNAAKNILARSVLRFGHEAPVEGIGA